MLSTSSSAAGSGFSPPSSRSASFGSMPAESVSRRLFFPIVQTRITASTGISPPKVKVIVSPRWEMSRMPAAHASPRSMATSSRASVLAGGSP